MNNFLEALIEILVEHEISAELMDRRDLKQFQKSWLETFVSDDIDVLDSTVADLRRNGIRAVREQVGKGYVIGIAGAAADDAYMALPAVDFICWQPYDTSALFCKGVAAMPRFASMPCGARTTVTAADLAWTATLPGLCCAGESFFARSGWQPDEN